MEDETIVITFLGMNHKVLHGLGGNVWEQAQMDVAFVGVHDGKVGRFGALLLRCQRRERLLFARGSFVEHISVEAFAVGIAVRIELI